MLPTHPVDKEADGNIDWLLIEQDENDQRHEVALHLYVERGQEVLVVNDWDHEGAENEHIEAIKDHDFGNVVKFRMTEFVSNYR